MEKPKFSCAKLIKQVPALILYIIQNVICPPAYCLWFVLLLPVKIYNPCLFWRIEGEIYDALLGIVASWSDISGHFIYESGANINVLKNDGVLLIANHQTPTDIGILMKCLHGKGVFQTTNWIMDWIFQYFNFGWVAKCHGDFFLLQGTDARRLPAFLKLGVGESFDCQVLRLKENLEANYRQKLHKWVILFPEGGLFHKRREGSRRFATKAKLPILENVAYPRLGALQCILNTTALNQNNAVTKPCETGKEQHASRIGHMKWLADVTIGYRTQMSSFQYLLGCFGAQETVVHYRVFPIEKLLLTDAATINEDWIFNLFLEKDKYLKYFKENGSFPQKCGKAVPVKSVNIAKVYGIQLLVIVTYVMLFSVVCFF